MSAINEHPVLWKAIPFLCYIKFEPSLLNMFEKWMDITPKECGYAIKEVIDIFF